MPNPTVDPAAPAVEHQGRVLDWRPRFDDRSLSYRIGAGVTELPATGRLWTHGPVLDQGREGACVGMGWSGDAAAEPVPVPGIDYQYALRWYKNAQRLDEWPGDQYSGTSVLAGAQYGQRLGLFTGYRWAKSAEELAAGIVRPASKGGGPAVIGVEWRAGSYDTDALGVLRPSGPVVGGHCLCVLGFIPATPSTRLTGQLEGLGLLPGFVSIGGPAFVVLNSWGPSFGINGLALVSADVMRAWVRAGGEFAMAEGRRMPTTSAAADQEHETEAQPATADAATTLHLRADEVRQRDRVLERVPAIFGQESVTVQQVRHVAGWAGRLVRIRSTAGVFTLRASDPVTVRRPVA